MELWVLWMGDENDTGTELFMRPYFDKADHGCIHISELVRKSIERFNFSIIRGPLPFDEAVLFAACKNYYLFVAANDLVLAIYNKALPGNLAQI